MDRRDTLHGRWRSCHLPKRSLHPWTIPSASTVCASVHATGGAQASSSQAIRLTTSTACASRTAVLGVCLFNFPPVPTTSCTIMVCDTKASRHILASLGHAVDSCSGGGRYGVSAKLASHVASDIVSRRSKHGVSRHRPYAPRSKNRSQPFYLLHSCRLISFRLGSPLPAQTITTSHLY